MSDRKVETISLGSGVSYAKVAARSAAFHEDNDKCHIETSCEFKDGWAIFAAKVTTKKGTFTGHSMDKVSGRQKQFEKQETIAVGRALAFAGYLASGDIATYEEMADVVTKSQLGSLKLKYARVHKAELKGLERPEQLQHFASWCKEVIGEEVDYDDPGAWCREWYDACWKLLQDGPSDDVPFEE